MKIQIASDIHKEFGSKTKFEIDPTADVLALAGDTHTNPDSLHKFLNKIHRHSPNLWIVVVPGNHEYYNHDVSEISKQYVERCNSIPNVHWLDNAAVKLDDVWFLGTTLYTDLSNPLEAYESVQCLSDFRVVKDKGQPITASWWTQRHRDAVSFLESELSNRQPEDNVVIVTHMCPSHSLRQEEFKNSPSAAAFSVEMSYLMERFSPTLWLYGHDHRQYLDRMIYDTRVVCNQFGYHFENLPYITRTVVV